MDVCVFVDGCVCICGWICEYLWLDVGVNLWMDACALMDV